MNEANTWSKTFAQLYSNFVGLRDEDQDRVRVGTDDILNLKTYHAVCKMTVDGQTKEAFIGMTMPTDERGNDEWIQAHPWPTEDPTLKIHPVKKPELENDPSSSTINNTTGSKQESSKPSETQARVKKIVQELGIDFATAKTLQMESQQTKGR